MNPPPPPTPRQHEEPTAPGRLFWITASAGAAIVLFGLYGLLTHLATSQRADFTKWIVGINLLHDLLIAPAASLIGYLITRLVHRPFRFPLQAGLFATAVVLLIGWAPLRGYGRARVPDNTSVAPLNYTTAIITVLAIVWTIVTASMIAAAVRRRPHLNTTNATPPLTPRDEAEKA